MPRPCLRLSFQTPRFALSTMPLQPCKGLDSKISTQKIRVYSRREFFVFSVNLCGKNRKYTFLRVQTGLILPGRRGMINPVQSGCAALHDAPKMNFLGNTKAHSIPPKRHLQEAAILPFMIPRRPANWVDGDSFFAAFCLLSNRSGLTKNQPFFLRKQEDFSRRVSN